MMKYFNTLGDSLKDFFKNLILIVPSILEGISTIIVMVIGMISFFSIMLTKYGEPFLALVTGDSMNALPIATLFEPLNLTIMIVLGIIFLLLLLIVVSYFKAGLLGMINELIEKKKAKGFFKYTKLWKKVFLVDLYKILIWILISLPVAILGLITYLVRANQTALIILGIVTAIIALATIVAYITYMFAFLFADVIVIRKKLSATAVLKKSYSWMKKKTRHVILTELTIVFIYLILAVFFSIIRPFAGETITSLIEQIVYFIYGLTMIIFLFKAYKEVDVKVTNKI